MAYVRIRSGACATPRDVLVRAIESGAARVLIEANALPQSFYDLKSGGAGEVVQGLANHGIQTAVVMPDLPDLSGYSGAFQAFIREANHGRALRFFASDADAEAWLQDRHTNPVPTDD